MSDALVDKTVTDMSSPAYRRLNEIISRAVNSYLAVWVHQGCHVGHLGDGVLPNEHTMADWEVGYVPEQIWMPLERSSGSDSKTPNFDMPESLFMQYLQPCPLVANAKSLAAQRAVMLQVSVVRPRMLKVWELGLPQLPNERWPRILVGVMVSLFAKSCDR